MNRRHFSEKLFTGLALGGLTSPWSAFYTTDHMKRKKLKPNHLKKGDTIGLITPGSPIDEEKFQKAINTLEQLGLKAFYTEQIHAKKGYLAGSDSDRLKDLHLMFERKDIKGIWCIRGGYGCTRLLPGIDYALIRKNPKVIIGYSDITALVNAIYKKTGLICFHGPVASSDPTDYTLEQFQQILMTRNDRLEIRNAKNHQARIIRPGIAKGKLVGGNLSLLTAITGTGYELSLKNKILFLEDIGEKPYRIDRMLTHLRQACDLNSAAAIMLGIFEDCEGGEDSLSLDEVLEDRLGDLNIPIIYGMSFGHIQDIMTIPIGAKAQLDTSLQTLNILENVVQ